MNTQIDFGNDAPGEGRSIVPETMDTLFVALLLTAVGSFFAGNVLLLDRGVLLATAPIAAYCVGLLLVYYAAARSLGLPWATALIWLGIVGLVWLRQPLLVSLVFWAVCAAAAVFALRHMRIQRSAVLPIMLMAILGVATSFSSFGVYTYFDNLNVARSGLIHKDVLFHSAIAAMIKNYGVVSTGLHGLVETPYYVLSHCVAALGSVASGRGTFEVYGVLTFVLLIPLVVFSAVACAVTIDVTSRDRVPVVWAMVCVLLVVCPALFSAWLLRDFFFMSESYMLSVAMLMLALPLLFVKRLRAQDIVLLGLLTAVMAYTKASTAVMFTGLAGARWLIRGRGRCAADFTALVLQLSVVVFFVFGLTGGADKAHGWSVLDYVRRISWQGESIDSVVHSFSSGELPGITVAVLAAAAIVTFFIFHFILSWVVLAVGIRREGWPSLWRRPAALYSWAAILGGSLFVLFFVRTNASDVYWFSNIAFFVSLPVLAGWMGAAVPKLALRQYLVLVASLVLIIGFSYKSYYKNSRWAPLRATKHESALVDALLDIRRSAPTNVVMKSPRHAWGWEPVLWGDAPWHTAAPFFYPAISERAWVDVIRPENAGDPYKDYTYASYDIDREAGGVKVPVALGVGMDLLDASLPRAKP